MTDTETEITLKTLTDIADIVRFVSASLISPQQAIMDIRAQLGINEEIEVKELRAQWMKRGGEIADLRSEVARLKELIRMHRRAVWGVGDLVGDDSIGEICSEHDAELYRAALGDGKGDPPKNKHAKLITKLKSRYGMEDLDEHIHELKSCEASAINSSSFEEQVEYLIEQAGVDWVIEVLLTEDPK